MGIRNSLKSIFDVYPNYETGQGIGKSDPLWTTFETLREEIAATTPVKKRPTLKVIFSVGKGRLTRLPWLALLDKRETASTQNGVYVVLLFREDMTGAYLCLSQGVTEHEKNEEKDAVGALERKREQAIMPVCNALLDHGFVKDRMELRSEHTRGKLYETGTAVHKFYPKDSLPTDKQIEGDLQEILSAYDSYLSADSSEIEEIKENVDSTSRDSYIQPSFDDIVESITNNGLIFSDVLLKRYHLSLKTRNFVIITGISGVGKTSLAECYARAANAQVCIVPVAPNWSCNEDLLGYYNPLSDQYQHTEFGRFVQDAADAYFDAIERNEAPRPFHLVLDEMNLARVEYYFAKFLSGMELRQRQNTALIELQDGKSLTLTPNLYFIGTVNIDETTHGFSDKVFDRAQLIEITHDRLEIEKGIKSSELRAPLLAIWDILAEVKPFSFRVIAEIEAYVGHAKDLNVSWEEALDHQIYHKILPKLAGIDPEIGSAVHKLHELSLNMYPLTQKKLSDMLKRQETNVVTSFF